MSLTKKGIKMPAENREVCKSKGIKCNKDCLCYGNHNLCYEETHLTIDEIVSKICKIN